MPSFSEWPDDSSSIRSEPPACQPAANIVFYESLPVKSLAWLRALEEDSPRPHNFVLLSLGLRDDGSARDLHHTAIAPHFKSPPAPFDGAPEPAHRPDGEAQHVAQRHQIKVRFQDAVFEVMNAGQPAHQQPYDERQSEQGEAQG